MEKLKELFKNKKIVAGTIVALLFAVVGVAFALNQPQTKNEAAQQSTISDAEHEKLVANIKKLQNADQKKTETVAPTEVKEEVKQKEENKKTQPVQPQPKKEVNVEQKPVPKVEQSKPVVKPEVPKSLPKPPVASAKPKPIPTPEKPKPTKYCEYNGNRKMVHNICNTGTPWGATSFERIRNKWVNRVNNGEIEQYIFKGETDRYHLITTDYLREGLVSEKSDWDSFCTVNGNCVGFRVDNP